MLTHVVVNTRNLEELKGIGELLADRQGLLGLSLSGTHFVNVHWKELKNCCCNPRFRLYSLDLSVTDLLNQTAETLFDSVAVENIIKLNLACTCISFSTVNALYRKYERNNILELPSHLRILDLGLTELAPDCVPVLQGILSLSRELRQLNLEYTGIAIQQLAKLNLKNNLFLEDVNYSCVVDDAPTCAEIQQLSD